MSREPSLDQERTLRLMGSALARASTIDGIAAIVRKAVRDLIGQRPNWEALFAVRDDGELTVVATASGDPAPAGGLGPERNAVFTAATAREANSRSRARTRSASARIASACAAADSLASSPIRC